MTHLIVVLGHALFDLIMSHQQYFIYVGMGLPEMIQYLARINVPCSRTQCSDAGEAQTCGLSVSSQALTLGHAWLCRCSGVNQD